MTFEFRKTVETGKTDLLSDLLLFKSWIMVLPFHTWWNCWCCQGFWVFKGTLHLHIFSSCHQPNFYNLKLYMMPTCIVPIQVNILNCAKWSQLRSVAWKYKDWNVCCMILKVPIVLCSCVCRIRHFLVSPRPFWSVLYSALVWLVVARPGLWIAMTHQPLVELEHSFRLNLPRVSWLVACAFVVCELWISASFSMYAYLPYVLA